MRRPPAMVLIVTVSVAAGLVTWLVSPQPAAKAAQAEARAWMAAHPAPAEAGFVNAMILPGGFADDGFLGDAARQACPDMPENQLGEPQPTASPAGPVTAAYSAGNLPGCGAWTATALTVSGHVVQLACGSIPRRVECPLFRYANGYIPFGGDFVRVRPGGGQVTAWGDIRIVQEFADSAPVLDVPDPGGPVWVTTRSPSPARGGAR